jgi:hypothetical protein
LNIGHANHAILVGQSNVVEFMISENYTLLAIELANSTHEYIERIMEINEVPMTLPLLTAYNKRLGTNVTCTQQR